MKAIILAGGLGTRLRPLTENLPKPLLPIKGRPIVEHAILNFKKHGVTDIILSIGYLAEKIQDYFGDGSKWGVKIDYSIEEEPLGTGGALKEASAGFTETFLATNGDNLADFDWTTALEIHRRHQAQITLALYPVDDVREFGIARLDGNKLLEFVEKPLPEEAPSNLNNAGAYVFEPAVMDILPEGRPSSVERDCFEKLAALGVIFSHRHEGQWLPTDTLEKYYLAEEKFKPWELI